MFILKKLFFISLIILISGCTLSNFDKVEKIRGLDITVVIKAQKVEHSYELLKQFNFPFIDKEIN